MIFLMQMIQVMRVETKTIHRATDDEANTVGFKKISNYVSTTKLDFQEMALLLYLLSKFDDWIVKPKVIAYEFSMSLQTIYKIINRLIAKGHIVKTNKHGYIHYEIHEKPVNVK